uniref:Protein kinase domain-containing protein n=1 Tax=Oryzias melastigma TaxID=30732 RepID=A0A3B3C365_ORYME
MSRTAENQPEEVSLWEILHTKTVSSFGLNEIRSIVRQVATAFQNPQNSHGILTPARIQLLVGRNQEQKVTSTEFSRVGDFHVDSCRHFRWYMAPETLLGSRTTETSHVWSLACIVAEMFLGFPFYNGFSDYEMIWNMTQTHGDFPDHLLKAGSKTKEFYFRGHNNQWLLKSAREYGRKIPKDVKYVSPDDFRRHQQKSGICSETEQTHLEQFIDLFLQMLVLDPAKRIPLHRVLRHPFVAGNRDLPRSSGGNFNTIKAQQPPPSSTMMDGIESKLSTVWIIGSGYYINGAHHTADQLFGENLGLNAKVTWIGRVNMRWVDVLTCFNTEVSQQRSSPDILVLHVGSNDLGNSNVSDLCCEMLKDLKHLNDSFPKMKIAYSLITPRLTWGKFDPMKINEDRSTVNKNVQLKARSFSGVVIEHPKLTPFESDLFKLDGIQFTSKGFEKFVSSIRDTIKQTLKQNFPRGQSQPQSNDYTPSVPHVHHGLKRKSSESKLSGPEKKRKTCEEEQRPENKKPVLKRKDRSEDLESPPKKRKVTGDNNSQNPAVVSEGKPESEGGHADSPATVAQPQNTSDSLDVNVQLDSPPTTRPPDIWIVGSSYISQAQLAADDSFGKRLNSKVKWIGIRDLGWMDAVDKVHQTALEEDGPPEVLVIHADGSELGKMHPTVIASQMTQDLKHLKEMYPQMKTALSLIIPRRNWGVGNPAVMEKHRTCLNDIMKGYADLFNVVVEHKNLVPADEKIYQRDGVRLTPQGNQLFLKNISTAIKECLREEQEWMTYSLDRPFSERDFLKCLEQTAT